MSRTAALVSFVLLASGAHAADEPPSFLRLHAETRGFMLGRPTAFKPLPDGKVLFLRTPPRAPVNALYEHDPKRGETRELLTPEALLRGAEEKLSPEERARRERMRVTTRGFSAFDVSEDGALVLLSLSGKLYTVKRPGGEAAELPVRGPVVDPKLSPDGKKVAYVRDRDLYVLELATRKETRVTQSPHPRVTNGLAEFIAQEELERHTGFWWSPDSKQLAFEEADTRPVETFHLVDVLHPEREAEPTPYPRPGTPNAKLRVGVVSATGGKVVWLRWDSERLPYLARVVWKDKAPLTLVVLTRKQRDLEVLAANPKTGAVTRLLAEQDAAWLNLDQTVPRWLPDGSAFLWSSERSGTRVLELRDAAGKPLATLSAAEDGYAGLADLDDKARVAWFHGRPTPEEQHLYRVSLDGGRAEKVTRAPGVHAAVFGKDHRTYVLRSSTLDAMPRAVVVADGREAGELPSVAEAPPLRPNVELLRVGAEALSAAIVRPRGFKKGQKYPVIVDVYGGPHHLSVQRAMATMLMRQFMADHGFIVVAADGRGTPGRGRAWERAIRDRFGSVPLDDQVAALRALAQKVPEMDLSRVGVTGWSFGGYMAALAVLRRPDVFHVGVAGAPVVDWRDYDTAYTERYLGLPEENEEAYRTSSLLTYARDLERPLLIVHGTRDDNVYFFHALKLAEALFRAGRPFELLPLPGLTHMVPDPAVKEALYGRIMGKMIEVLRPERPKAMSAR